MTQTIKVLVVPPPPNRIIEVREVPAQGWTRWYPLIHPTTELFQPIRLGRSVDILCDEEARFKKLPFNFAMTARAPQIDMDFSFAIDMTNGQGMRPNEPGVGLHLFFGTVLFARRRGGTYVSLTDKDITYLRDAFKGERA